MTSFKRRLDATLHPAQAAWDGRVDIRFLPADDAAEQHMRRIGCNEAFELGSVKCERILLVFTFLLSMSTPIRPSLAAQACHCLHRLRTRAPSVCRSSPSADCRLSKTVAFVLQYLGQRWAAPPGSTLVLLPPAGQTVIDAGSFWSAGGHPGLTVRAPSELLSARPTGRTAPTPCMTFADRRVWPIYVPFAYNTHRRDAAQKACLLHCRWAASMSSSAGQRRSCCGTPG